MKATIELFNALPITKKGKKVASEKLLKLTISKGFIFSPEVIANYTEEELIKYAKTIGLSATQLNSSFHKSWNKIKTASLQQLVLEQLVHYITTYGFESMGMYDKNSVYIPNEKLEIPEVTENITLVVIKGYTKSELKDKVFGLLSGIALEEKTINHIVEILDFVKIDASDLDNVKNKEAKCILYGKLDLLPNNPVEFLRYLVYKTTKKTLLIKSPASIKEIKEADHTGIASLIERYDVKKLAEIFNRFKPIFLAFKGTKRLNKTINKIGKLSKIYHKPLEEDYLNSITGKLKNGKRIFSTELKTELNKVNIYRKIRLAYALNFRDNDPDSIMYRIRNGKSYATEFDFSGNVKNTLNIVLKSIASDLSHLKGKKIYIPEYINYSLPSTEKQFTGYFPSGTFVEIPRNMIFGIHWNNYKQNRIDLDLSLINDEGYKIGWNGAYRTDNGQILFSGDMTDAPNPNGATELFYIGNGIKQSALMFVNFFNHIEKTDIPFEIIVAKESPKNFNRNYMVDPNNVISIAKTTISQRQKILGLLISTTKSIKFYFAETSISDKISSSSGKTETNARKYLIDYYKNTIGLKEVLEMAKVKLVLDKEKCEIDLSPEKLEKDTIINLLTK